MGLPGMAGKMSQAVDGGGLCPVEIGPTPGQSGFANNPIVKGAEAFVSFLVKTAIGGASAKIGADLWSKYGSGITSAIKSSGSAVVNYVVNLYNSMGDPPPTDPRTSKSNQTTTLSQADQTLLTNFMNSAKADGVLSLMPGAITAVYNALQTTGSFVDYTA